MVHNELWKILEEMGIPEHLTCLLRNLHAGRKQQLELDIEQQTGFKSGKVHVKAVYCHPVYLTYMQSTFCKMLESRNINNLRYADDTIFMAECI